MAAQTQKETTPKLTETSLCDYDDISTTYSADRKAIGVDLMRRYFFGVKGNGGGAPILTLLDAGCGTGNYTCALAGSFASVHAGDINEGMLREAKRNLLAKSSEDGGSADLVKKVEFSLLDISAMQFDDASFDCAINCQVIHHLPRDENFAALRKACAEWHRVLKPGGKFCMNFNTHRQQLEGVWWGELIPAAVAEWQSKAPDLEDVKAALLAAGFAEDNIRCEPVIGESLYDDALYLEPKNFLDINKFSRSDSTFALASEDELTAAVARVKSMEDAGTLHAWFLEKESHRAKIGMTTMVYATKN